MSNTLINLRVSFLQTTIYKYNYKYIKQNRKETIYMQEQVKLQTVEMEDDFFERLEMFLEDIYDKDGDINKEYDQTLFNSMKREVNLFWKNKFYKPMDVMNLMFIHEVVKESKVKYIEQIYSLCNIRITTKDRKRGKSAIFQRLLQKYHRENVRKTLDSLLETFLRDEIAQMREIDEQENQGELLSQLIENVGLLPILWIAEKIMKDNKLVEKIKEVEPIRYEAGLAQLAMFYIEFEYEKVMEHPEQINDSEKLKSEQKKQKQLIQKLGKKEKETSELKQEINALQQEKKKLEADAYELYQSALDEIEALKKENESMQEYYLNILCNLDQQIQDLQQENMELRQGTHKEDDDIDLKGKTIAVIGGTKVRHIREIIESHNGHMTFASETDFNKIEGAVHKADAVFFLKEVVGHHFFRESYSLAKKYNIPFVFVNSIGVSSFKRELKRLVS